MILNRLFIKKCFRNLLVKSYSLNIFTETPAKRIKILRTMALPKTRKNPIIKKLDTPQFKSIFTKELEDLAALFTKYNYEIRIAGGAVRDLLLNIQPTDLDFATVATPEQMKEMFTKENVRMINMKGEKHGTITPRINDKENFEVTTLRIDVLSDGRHAEVQFTTDWLLDANRRDLTINSMFLGLDGSVYDYFYGSDDLEKRRVAFVGDAATRIQEDYLRILRYFRFYGRIAVESDCHEEATLKAIRDNAAGLERISGERIWTELKKILEGNFAGELIQKIVDLGLGPYIGLPSNTNLSEMEKVWKQSGHLKMNAITLLSSLLRSEDDVVALNNRLKLSAYERELAFFIVEHRQPKINLKPLLPYQQLVVKSKSKLTNTHEWVIEVLKYNNSPLLDNFKTWTIPKFPVNGVMLTKAGVDSGKFMGKVIIELKAYWADNEFSLSAEDLLKKVPHIVGVLKDKNNK